MSEFLSQYQQGQQAERQDLMDLVDELMRDERLSTPQDALRAIHRELIERYQYEPLREVVEAMSKESNE